MESCGTDVGKDSQGSSGSVSLALLLTRSDRMHVPQALNAKLDLILLALVASQGAGTRVTKF